MQEKVDQDGSAWVKTRTINTPTAKKLAEWILLAGDLEYALRRAVLWNELATTKAMSDNKCEISVSLFRDTVITFVSCFDNTLSAFLEPKVVYTTSSGRREYLEWLKDLRNTWIAHRSGPNRQCVVSIVIDNTTGEFQGLGHQSALYQGPKPDVGKDLISMMEIALDHARREVKNLDAQLRDEIRNLKDTERLRLPAANTVIPRSREVRMGRRKFGNIKRSSGGYMLDPKKNA